MNILGRSAIQNVQRTDVVDEGPQSAAPTGAGGFRIRSHLTRERLPIISRAGYPHAPAGLAILGRIPVPDHVDIPAIIGGDGTSAIKPRRKLHQVTFWLECGTCIV